jgi:hypothetical protein
MSVVQPVPTSPIAAEGDLFDLYRTDDGVVLHFGPHGLAAAGPSQAIDVVAGPNHVGRAAALVQAALDRTAGLGVAMGALPYDGSCDAVIRLPERVVRGASRGVTAPQPDWAIESLIPDPLPVEYEAAVERALAAIDAGTVEKVVLARTLIVQADRPIDARILARRLDAEALRLWPARRPNSLSDAEDGGCSATPLPGPRVDRRIDLGTARSRSNCSTLSRSSANTVWLPRPWRTGLRRSARNS